MSLIIVGHGPSMIIDKMGDVIDSFDTVVRLKRCQNTLKQPDYYGTKTTIVGGSLTIAADLRTIHAEKYWIFVDSRHSNVNIDFPMINRFFNGKAVLDKGLCDEWDKRYRELRTPMAWGNQIVHSKSSEKELGENHLSQGFKAIIYAAAHTKEEEINLIGFDNLFTGEFTWSTTRGPEWTNYPSHNWKTENALIRYVEREFRKTVNFILPEIS